MIDGFLGDTTELNSWIRSLRARGDLKRGQVGDLKRAVSRGDLMKWVPTEASTLCSFLLI